jgi:hypothetical protein
MCMEYMFHAQCFLDLSKEDFVLALQNVEGRKRLEYKCALLQEAEKQHRAAGGPRGHAVVFRANGLCWGWLDIRDSLETALTKRL